MYTYFVHLSGRISSFVWSCFLFLLCGALRAWWGTASHVDVCHNRKCYYALCREIWRPPKPLGRHNHSCRDLMCFLPWCEWDSRTSEYFNLSRLVLCWGCPQMWRGKTDQQAKTWFILMLIGAIFPWAIKNYLSWDERGETSAHWYHSGFMVHDFILISLPIGSSYGRDQGKGNSLASAALKVSIFSVETWYLWNRLENHFTFDKMTQPISMRQRSRPRSQPHPYMQLAVFSIAVIMIFVNSRY